MINPSALCFGAGAIFLIGGTISVIRAKSVRMVIHAKVISCEPCGEDYRAVLEYVDRSGETVTVEQIFRRERTPGEYVKMGYPGEDMNKRPNKFLLMLIVIAVSAVWMAIGYGVHLMTGGGTQEQAAFIQTEIFMPVVGILFIGAGLMLSIVTSRTVKKNRQFPIDGVIVDYQKYSSHDADGAAVYTRYRAIAEYTDDHGIVCRLATQHSYNSPKHVPLGRRITLYRNPETGVVTDNAGEHTAVWMGVVFAAVGVILLITTIKN